MSRQKAKESKLVSILLKEDIIQSALWYGSSLYSEDAPDFDIAIMIPSRNGVVDSLVYKKLYNVRKLLCKALEIDVDLVPHTEDELLNYNSPLWNPRYHPALCFGKNIKNQFPNLLPPSRLSKLKFNYSDLIVSRLFDTRTVTRRQLIRSMQCEESRIFIAKLSHGVGNALTYISLINHQNYLSDPSDIKSSFKIFDSVYKISSERILLLINECKNIVSKGRNLSSKKILNMMSWYEYLLHCVLERKPRISESFLKNLPQK
jgi:predicted nucleotidyltransferase